MSVWCGEGRAYALFGPSLALVRLFALVMFRKLGGKELCGRCFGLPLAGDLDTVATQHALVLTAMEASDSHSLEEEILMNFSDTMSNGVDAVIAAEGWRLQMPPSSSKLQQFAFCYRELTRKTPGDLNATVD
ncbi:Transcriptional regulatory protein pro1 [Fusarium oxysporum f. sp. albedinis]|nr:Transcriptional regulatory protein pro1 [Fusarium oxysporum f. sp. albedinis]